MILMMTIMTITMLMINDDERLLITDLHIHNNNNNQ